MKSRLFALAFLVVGALSFSLPSRAQQIPATLSAHYISLIESALIQEAPQGWDFKTPIVRILMEAGYGEREGRAFTDFITDFENFRRPVAGLVEGGNLYAKLEGIRFLNLNGIPVEGGKNLVLERILKNAGYSATDAFNIVNQMLARESEGKTSFEIVKAYSNDVAMGKLGQGGHLEVAEEAMKREVRGDIEPKESVRRGAKK